MTPEAPATPGTERRWRRAAVVVTSVGIAVVANLMVYFAGRAAGGQFTFTRAGQTIEVDAATVAGFTVVPLAAGLALVAILGRRLPALFRIALIGAPTLALVTIVIMTLPAGFDPASTVALAMCHVSLVPVSIISLRALRRWTPPRDGAVDSTSPGSSVRRDQAAPTTGINP